MDKIYFTAGDKWISLTLGAMGIMMLLPIWKAFIDGRITLALFLVAGCALYAWVCISPVSYRLTDHCLVIRRFLFFQRIPYRNIRSVEVTECVGERRMVDCIEIEFGDTRPGRALIMPPEDKVDFLTELNRRRGLAEQTGRFSNRGGSECAHG